MFKNFNTVKKVGWGFAGLTLVLVAAVALTLWQASRTQVVTDALVNRSAPMTEASLRLTNGINMTIANLRGWVMLRDTKFKDERQEAWTTWIDPAQARLQELMETGDAKQRAQYSIVEDGLKELRKYQQEIESLPETEKDQATNDIREKTIPRQTIVLQALEGLIQDLETPNQQNRALLVSLTDWLTILEWILLAVGVAISGILATLIIQSVNSSIAAVKGSTQEVRSASHEIAAGAQQQVTSLNETATSLNEITTTAEEFKATMQEFADRARAVQEAAAETAKQTNEGRSLTQESAGRIKQVRVNSQAVAESVAKLAEQMQRIGEITATVNEIAEQTKLLALNASIEAARAGEEGRGFAVVATQVRELANQSKDSSGRIESLISGTQKSMQEVVNKIEQGSRLTDESNDLVRRVAIAFEEIARAIQQTTTAMGQINTGAKQQEQGISELVSSITEIDSASKESLASAEQTRRSILAIDEQIKRLDQTMAAF